VTTKAAFSPGEWKQVLEGPPTAGMMVITASRGGMFRETLAMSKAYSEARAEHGDSELLDEIVAAKPQVDHARYHSAEELRDNGLRHIRDAVALVEIRKAFLRQTVGPVRLRGSPGRRLCRRCQQVIPDPYPSYCGKNSHGILLANWTHIPLIMR
jgi:hypothetical protein